MCALCVTGRTEIGSLGVAVAQEVNEVRNLCCLFAPSAALRLAR